MVSDRKLKYFVGRIKEMERINKDKICTTYSSDGVNIVDCILTGSVPIRTKTEIKERLSELKKNSRYNVSSMELDQIFNVDDIRTKSKEISKKNESIRSKLIERLNIETTELIDKTYFSSEPELLTALNDFKNKDFTVI